MPKKFAHGGKPKKKQRIARAPVEAGLASASAAPGVAAAPRPAAAAFARPSASAIQAVPRPAGRPSRSAAALPTDYGYVATDLRRIGVMAGGAVIVLGVLAIALR